MKPLKVEGHSAMSSAACFYKVDTGQGILRVVTKAYDSNQVTQFTHLLR